LLRIAFLSTAGPETKAMDDEGPEVRDPTPDVTHTAQKNKLARERRSMEEDMVVVQVRDLGRNEKGGCVGASRTHVGTFMRCEILAQAME
jgi:hypothetical protein